MRQFLGVKHFSYTSNSMLIRRLRKSMRSVSEMKTKKKIVGGL